MGPRAGLPGFCLEPGTVFVPFYSKQQYFRYIPKAEAHASAIRHPIFARLFPYDVGFIGSVQNEGFMRGSGNISLGCRIVGISSRNIFCDGWPAARSRGAASHPAAFEKGKTSRSEVYETFPIFSRHLRAGFFLLLLTFISSVGHSCFIYKAPGLLGKGHLAPRG